MANVRAKFTVQSVEDSGNGKKIVLTPQYDQSISEDRSYSKATPSGRLEMQVDNEKAAQQFTQGKSFYLDFTPA